LTAPTNRGKTVNSLETADDRVHDGHRGKNNRERRCAGKREFYRAERRRTDHGDPRGENHGGVEGLLAELPPETDDRTGHKASPNPHIENIRPERINAAVLEEQPLNEENRRHHHNRRPRAKNGNRERRADEMAGRYRSPRENSPSARRR
jgi:hypothetical protein